MAVNFVLTYMANFVFSYKSQFCFNLCSPFSFDLYTQFGYDSYSQFRFNLILLHATCTNFSSRISKFLKKVGRTSTDKHANRSIIGSQSLKSRVLEQQPIPSSHPSIPTLSTLDSTTEVET